MRFTAETDGKDIRIHRSEDCGCEMMVNTKLIILAKMLSIIAEVIEEINNAGANKMAEKLKCTMAIIILEMGS